MTSVPEHLTSSHPADICRDATCPEAVKRDPATGRYFITMGHAGFNSVANNAAGYATANKARASVRHFLGLRARDRVPLGPQASPTARGILDALASQHLLPGGFKVGRR